MSGNQSKQIDKFTPGPWSYDMFEVNDSDGFCIAEVDQEKNGCLMAAAPELLAAAESLVAQIEAAARAGIDLSGYVGVGEALRAIAKARGEG